MNQSTIELDMTLQPSAEHGFFEAIRNARDPLAALRIFGPQYHYFSVHQIHAFAGILRQFTPTDRAELTQLSEVLFEELGEGQADRAHSLLLERFMIEIGGKVADLPIEKGNVVDGVLEYVDCLYEAFWGQDLPVALATYCFLENSAVQTYPELVKLLEPLNLPSEAIEFFVLHTGLEVEHAKAAQELVQNHITTVDQAVAFNRQFSQLRDVWARFWADITNKTHGS